MGNITLDLSATFQKFFRCRIHDIDNYMITEYITEFGLFVREVPKGVARHNSSSLRFENKVDVKASNTGPRNGVFEKKKNNHYFTRNVLRNVFKNS